ncbi:MAG: PIN domain-containing protein [Syntrophomonadaceae bacterium]|nr:PIN domain-containing protein [Syntrophomonadaceae bacterium]
MGIESFMQSNNRIAFDTNVFIALFSHAPLGEKVVPLIDAAANQGRLELLASVMSFAECAVKPYQEGNWGALDQIKLMFQMPHLTIYPVDDRVAEEAARLRAVYNFKMPDAIHLATAIIHQAKVFLTNDYRLTVIKEIPVMKLEEL